MVLGKLPVPGRPTIWISVRQGPTALAVGAGGGCLDIFTLIYPFFPLSPSLWETDRYGLKYCLKGPLNPKPTNQPITNSNMISLKEMSQEFEKVEALGPKANETLLKLVNYGIPAKIDRNVEKDLCDKYFCQKTVRLWLFQK